MIQAFLEISLHKTVLLGPKILQSEVRCNHKEILISHHRMIWSCIWHASLNQESRCRRQMSQAYWVR